MLDLRQDLSSLWQAASRLTPRTGGRLVMFVAAEDGEGVSSVATSFAMLASARCHRMTWLVDLDLRGNPVHAAFSEGRFKGVGRLGRPLDASLGGEQIYAVPGAAPDPALSKLLTAHQIEGQRLLISRFRNERLSPGQSVHLRAAPGWWDTLRRSADWGIVDAPALARSSAALTFAPQMDGVVIVVQAERTPAGVVEALRAAIEGTGGLVIGTVLNQAQTGRHIVRLS